MNGIESRELARRVHRRRSSAIKADESAGGSGSFDSVLSQGAAARRLRAARMAHRREPRRDAAAPADRLHARSAARRGRYGHDAAHPLEAPGLRPSARRSAGSGCRSPPSAHAAADRRDSGQAAADSGDAAADRTEQQHKDLDDLLSDASRVSLKPTRDRIAALQKELKALGIPTALVMRERVDYERPSAYVRRRGSFMDKREQVYAGVPETLPPLADDQMPNRLGLAHWLVDRENPLTARVAVNRAWEQFFGRGLVETSEDFGTQGTPPSHPELLDWLATELVHAGMAHEGDPQDDRHVGDLPAVVGDDAGAGGARSRTTGCSPAVRVSGWKRRWCATRCWPPAGCSA